ncbi:hypothetical protein GCM10022217_21030 [Chryseobacterium ginsenosidimutans]|uniref:hypothetical protein n=1 Tax=Chryseobacterium ginsenosidimutans TaxID=687846 RepID=UPI0031DD300B
MNLKNFKELTEQINLECFYLTTSQQEEKVIQLIDLHHFIDCHNHSIEVINYLHHSINIIKDNGIKKGILFYDLRQSLPVNLPDSAVFKEHHHLEELWFVFVEENYISDFIRHTDFVFENDIELLYDKIFIFHFFQSVIYNLK